jgi:hypothetical protein
MKEIELPYLTLVAHINAHLQEVGITQTEFARTYEIPEAVMSYLLNGLSFTDKYRPHLMTALRLTPQQMNAYHKSYIKTKGQQRWEPSTPRDVYFREKLEGVEQRLDAVHAVLIDVGVSNDYGVSNNYDNRFNVLETRLSDIEGVLKRYDIIIRVLDRITKQYGEDAYATPDAKKRCAVLFDLENLVAKNETID